MLPFQLWLPSMKDFVDSTCQNFVSGQQAFDLSSLYLYWQISKGKVSYLLLWQLASSSDHFVSHTHAFQNLLEEILYSSLDIIYHISIYHQERLRPSPPKIIEIVSPQVALQYTMLKSPAYRTPPAVKLTAVVQISRLGGFRFLFHRFLSEPTHKPSHHKNEYDDHKHDDAATNQDQHQLTVVSLHFSCNVSFKIKKHNQSKSHEHMYLNKPLIKHDHHETTQSQTLHITQGKVYYVPRNSDWFN